MSLIDNLKKMSHDELKQFAVSQGVQFHHKAGPEKVLQAIVEQLNQQPKPPKQDDIDPRLAAPKEPVWSSEEEIEAMLKPIRDRQPAFEAIYSQEDRTVTFRCKGAEDCLSMSVPMRILKQKAGLISRGRLMLIGYSPTEFEGGNATGKNAYTNTVLR